MQPGFTVVQFNRITTHNNQKTITRCLALAIGSIEDAAGGDPALNLIVFNTAKAAAVGGPNWQDAFDRLSGVKHQDHADVTSGAEIMFYSDQVTLYAVEDVRLHEDVLAPEPPPTTVNTPPAAALEASGVDVVTPSAPEVPSGEDGSPASSASGTVASDSISGANTDSSNASPVGSLDSSTASPEPSSEQSAPASQVEAPLGNEPTTEITSSSSSTVDSAPEPSPSPTSAESTPEVDGNGSSETSSVSGASEVAAAGN